MSNEQPAPTPAQPKPGSDNTFFDWMRGLGVPRQPGWIGGVSAGIAARLGIDPIIVRGIIVVIAVLGGPALLLYAAAWLLLPDSYDRIHLQEAIRGNFDRALAGIGVMVLLSLLPIAQGISWQGFAWWPLAAGDGAWLVAPSLWAIFWTLAVIGSMVWLIIWLVNRSKDSPVSSSTPAPATDRAKDEPAAASKADASGATVSAAPLAATTAPEAPPAPPTDAGDGELAAWKEQQAAWKREHDAWKQQQAADERERRQQRAAEERRVRQEQSAERHRAAVEAERRTRSNPIYSLVAIGLAIIAGAATTLAIGDTGDATAAITGMAVALGVLGLAIIINGFRGKRSGGSSGVAFLLVVVLSATSFLNWANGPLAGDSTRWAPSYSSSDHDSRRTVVSGNVTLDLTEYFSEPPVEDDFQYGMVNLYVGKGDVRVILPADEFSQIEVRTFAGSIEAPGDRTEFGPFAQAYDTFTPRTGEQTQLRDFFVNVWVASGDVTVTQSSSIQVSR